MPAMSLAHVWTRLARRGRCVVSSRIARSDVPNQRGPGHPENLVDPAELPLQRLANGG